MQPLKPVSLENDDDNVPDPAPRPPDTEDDDFVPDADTDPPDIAQLSDEDEIVPDPAPF